MLCNGNGAISHLQTEMGFFEDFCYNWWKYIFCPFWNLLCENGNLKRIFSKKILYIPLMGCSLFSNSHFRNEVCRALWATPVSTHGGAFGTIWWSQLTQEEVLFLCRALNSAGATDAATPVNFGQQVNAPFNFWFWYFFQTFLCDISCYWQNPAPLNWNLWPVHCFIIKEFIIKAFISKLLLVCINFDRQASWNSYKEDLRCRMISCLRCIFRVKH